jgi:hypothetical protein
LAIKIDITRQPLLLALATSLALTVLGLSFRLPFNVPLPEVSIETPLGALLAGFQRSHHVWSVVAVFLTAITSAYLVTRSSVRHNLYTRRTYIAMVMFSLCTCCLFGCEEWLRSWATLLALQLACRNFESGFRRSYAFGEMFRGAFFLGLVPLLYAPAATVLVSLPLMIFLFHRPAREVPVIVVGACLPLAISSYVWWGMGYELGYVAERTIAAATAESGYSLFGGAQLFDLLAMGAVLFVVLMSLGVYMIELGALKFKARRVHIFYVVLAAMILLSSLAEGSDCCTWLLMSLPLSVSMPLLFVRAEVRFSMVTYVVLIALAVMSLIG